MNRKKAVNMAAFSIAHFAKCWQKKVIRCAFTAQVRIRFQDNGTKVTFFPDSTKHLLRFLKKNFLCKEQTAKVRFYASDMSFLL